MARAGPAQLLLLLMFAGAGALARASGQEDSARRVESFEPEVVDVEALPPERVRLSVSVLDGEGLPVAGLTAADFEVLEAGEPQRIIDFGLEFDRRDRPLSVVLLVDRSESIGKQMSKWYEGCMELLSALRSIDEIRISTFTDHVEVVQDFTNRREDLQRVVDRFRNDLWGEAGTRIFRAVEETLWDLRQRRGRKVIFLLTDGVEDRPLVGPTVENPAVHGLVRLAVEWQVTVVTILPGVSSYPYLAVQDLAVQTGGWWLYPSDDLGGLIRDLGERLLGSYYLSYDSTRDPDDLRRRRVEVRLTGEGREGLELRTVEGVWGQVPLLDALVSEIGSDEEEDRLRAVGALELSEEEAALKPLLRALEDDSPRVRAAAAEALARRGENSALKRILRLLDDPEPAVRESALQALEVLMSTAPDEKTRTRILDSLERADWEP